MTNLLLALTISTLMTNSNTDSICANIDKISSINSKTNMCVLVIADIEKSGITINDIPIVQFFFK